MTEATWPGVEVSGGKDPATTRVLSGHYREDGSHHNRPCYTRLKVTRQDPPVVLYYWDVEEDGGNETEEVPGWWFSPSIGDDCCYAFHSSASLLPPYDGWHAPFFEDVDNDFKVVLGEVPATDRELLDATVDETPAASEEEADCEAAGIDPITEDVYPEPLEEASLVDEQLTALKSMVDSSCSTSAPPEKLDTVQELMARLSNLQNQKSAVDMDVKRIQKAKEGLEAVQKVKIKECMKQTVKRVDRRALLEDEQVEIAAKKKDLERELQALGKRENEVEMELRQLLHEEQNAEAEHEDRVAKHGEQVVKLQEQEEEQCEVLKEVETNLAALRVQVKEELKKQKEADVAGSRRENTTLRRRTPPQCDGDEDQASDISMSPGTPDDEEEGAGCNEEGDCVDDAEEGEEEEGESEEKLDDCGEAIRAEVEAEFEATPRGTVFDEAKGEKHGEDASKALQQRVAELSRDVPWQRHERPPTSELGEPQGSKANAEDAAGASSGEEEDLGLQPCPKRRAASGPTKGEAKDSMKESLKEKQRPPKTAVTKVSQRRSSTSSSVKRSRSRKAAATAQEKKDKAKNRKVEKRASSSPRGQRKTRQTRQTGRGASATKAKARKRSTSSTSSKSCRNRRGAKKRRWVSTSPPRKRHSHTSRAQTRRSPSKRARRRQPSPAKKAAERRDKEREERRLEEEEMKKDVERKKAAEEREKKRKLEEEKSKAEAAARIRAEEDKKLREEEDRERVTFKFKSPGEKEELLKKRAEETKPRQDKEKATSEPSGKKQPIEEGAREAGREQPIESVIDAKKAPSPVKGEETSAVPDAGMAEDKKQLEAVRQADSSTTEAAPSTSDAGKAAYSKTTTRALKQTMAALAKPKLKPKQPDHPPPPELLAPMLAPGTLHSKPGPQAVPEHLSIPWGAQQQLWQHEQQLQLQLYQPPLAGPPMHPLHMGAAGQMLLGAGAPPPPPLFVHMPIQPPAMPPGT